MSRSAKAEAALALHRFGMGPCPGSIVAIEADPRGALIAELDRPAISELAAANLPSSAKAYRAVTDAFAKRQAKAIVAKKEQDAKRQQMAEASAMMEGAAPSMGDMAAKMAAEAVPDPGRPIRSDRPAISELAAANLPSSAKAYRAVTDAFAKRQAKAIVAKKEQDAKRQQMAEASAMMEGAAPSMGDMAAKMAAEAVPDPGRPI